MTRNQTPIGDGTTTPSSNKMERRNSGKSILQTQIEEMDTEELRYWIKRIEDTHDPSPSRNAKLNIMKKHLKIREAQE